MGREKNVMIVGAGITGSFTACRLREKFSDVSITILEKSRGAGGRMATNRHPEGKPLACDYGAQYLSATPEFFQKHVKYYNELLECDIIRPFKGVIAGENPYGTPGNKHFVAPNGMNSIAKYYLEKSGADVKYGETCNFIDFAGDKSKWRITTDAKSLATEADAVLLTIPVPQILKLNGSIADLCAPYRNNLEKVEYSSRYTLVMYFDQWNIRDIPWTCNYIEGDDCVRFLSLDAQKRQKDPSYGMSLLAQTSVPFGIKHLEDDFKSIEPVIKNSVHKLLPQLPEPSYTKCHRWKYSQVYKPYPGTPGNLVLHETPLLILGGDAFLSSNFDNCIESSLAMLRCFE